MAATFYAVAVYDIGQCYGGPEEGGWWYADGSLTEVLDIVQDEDLAYEYARGFNDSADLNSYGEGEVATVVQIPRTEREHEAEACHLDSDQLGAEITRWDIPAEYNRRYPHYC